MNDMRPRFSVIIPFYNSEKYLEECIRSVIKQSYKNFELILVDDGSTDFSLEIVKRFAAVDSRIVYFQEENSGVAAARNLGIRRATGEYLVFLDSDDLLFNEALFKLDETVEIERPDMIVCSSYYEFGDSNEKEIVLFNDSTLKRKRSLTDNKVLCQSLSSMCIGIYSNSFVQHNSLMVRTDITMAEDTDFFFRALTSASSLIIAKCALFKYRANPESVSNNLKYEQIRDVMLVCGDHLRKLSNSKLNYELDVTKAKDFFATKYIHFAVKISNLKGNERKNLCNQLLRDRVLLEGARGKPERLFIFLLKSIGADATVSFFAFLVLLRNKTHGNRGL